jgi:AmmeMemoRadiSam system protein B
MHEYHPAPFLTSAHQAYATPLGRIPIDQDSVNQLDDLLRASGQRSMAHIVADPEHSLEIELPFLQRSLRGTFNLLPIMVRTRNEMAIHVLGSALGSILEGKNALLVASTDLSHFYPQLVAEKLDQDTLQRIESFSPENVLEAQEEGRGFACGASAVAGMFWAAEVLGANTVKILHHSTSADETGDSSSVVGYGAAAVYQRDLI